MQLDFFSTLENGYNRAKRLHVGEQVKSDLVGFDVEHPLTQLDITTSFHKSLSSASVQDPVFLALTSLHALVLLFYSNDFCHWHWLVMLLCPNCRKLHLCAISNITDWNLESTSAQVSYSSPSQWLLDRLFSVPVTVSRGLCNLIFFSTLENGYNRAKWAHKLHVGEQVKSDLVGFDVDAVGWTGVPDSL